LFGPKDHLVNEKFGTSLQKALPLISKEDALVVPPEEVVELGLLVPPVVFVFNTLPGGILGPPTVDVGGLFDINFTF